MSVDKNEPIETSGPEIRGEEIAADIAPASDSSIEITAGQGLPVEGGVVDTTMVPERNGIDAFPTNAAGDPALSSDLIDSLRGSGSTSDLPVAEFVDSIPPAPRSRTFEYAEPWMPKPPAPTQMILLMRTSSTASLPLPCRADYDKRTISWTLQSSETLVVVPRSTQVIPIGLKIDVPPDVEMRVCALPELTTKGIGTPHLLVDQEGVISILLNNHSRDGISFRIGDPVVEMYFAELPHLHVEFSYVEFSAVEG